MRKATSIDEYLARVSPEQRATLERLRKAIHAIVPAAEECISYGLPAFRLDGEVIAGFAATAKGCSYYPFSGKTLRTLAHDVARFTTTKGALQFATDKPLSVALLRKLIRTRRAEAH
jgi:uncharacterized protein YdhG (YjbR/CyaY superfamily)